MSWTAKAEATSYDIAVAIDNCEVDPPESGLSSQVTEQLALARKLAKEAVADPAFGTGSKKFVVSLSGHAQPEHEGAESLGINVSSSPV